MPMKVLTSVERQACVCVCVCVRARVCVYEDIISVCLK